MSNIPKHEQAWQPITTAPRDGTLVLLLVHNDVENAEANPLEDSDMSRTVGFNNFENDGEDEWKMAGWCWSNDYFTEGAGEPRKWMPFPAVPEAT